jgi:chaperonin GroES
MSANNALCLDQKFIGADPFGSTRCLLTLLFHIQGDSMKLRPLGDRVIVKRVESETKTASGIVIPDSAAEKPDQGEVLAVGPGKTNDKGETKALTVKVGDRVLFGKYSGQTVKVGGDELLVMKEEDLFAVVE